MDKKTLIIGGIMAALGVVALLVLSRGSGGGAAASGPAVAAPLQIPQYPQAPPLPALNVVATPYYQTFNIAPNRSLQPNPTDVNAADRPHCDCAQDDAPTVVSKAFIKQSVENLRARFAMGVNAGNMIEQFPPYLYPWMYQNAGNA